MVSLREMMYQTESSRRTRLLNDAQRGSAKMATEDEVGFSYRERTVHAASRDFFVQGFEDVIWFYKGRDKVARNEGA
jgi:hypothetical protein